MSDWTQLKFNMDVPVNVTLHTWGDGQLVKPDNYDKPQYFVGDKCKFVASKGLHDLLMAKGVKDGDTISIEKKSSQKTEYGVFHVNGESMDTLGSGIQQPPINDAVANNVIGTQPPVPTAVPQVAPSQVPLSSPVETVSGLGNNGEDKADLVSRIDNTINLLVGIKKDMGLPF